jgi:hypothetical protein
MRSAIIGIIKKKEIKSDIGIFNHPASGGSA